jgi:hypothetical protein
VGDQDRFVLGGTSKLDVVLPASAVLQCGGASKFKLNWQLWPKNILLRPNSMTTVWMDVMDRYIHFIFKKTKSSETEINMNTQNKMIQNQIIILTLAGSSAGESP